MVLHAKVTIGEKVTLRAKMSLRAYLTPTLVRAKHLHSVLHTECL